MAAAGGEIAAAARSPDRIAPSINVGHSGDVSLPAQWNGPTGSRTAVLNRAVAPGAR